MTSNEKQYVYVAGFHYRFKVERMFLGCKIFRPTTKARNYRILYVSSFYFSIISRTLFFNSSKSGRYN